MDIRQLIAQREDGGDPFLGSRSARCTLQPTAVDDNLIALWPNNPSLNVPRDSLEENHRPSFQLAPKALHLTKRNPPRPPLNRPNPNHLQGTTINGPR